MFRAHTFEVMWVFNGVFTVSVTDKRDFYIMNSKNTLENQASQVRPWKALMEGERQRHS